MKPKGTINNAKRLFCDLQFLNGENRVKFGNVPLWILDYTPDEKDKSNETFKLWFKLEEGGYKLVEEQLKKNLREISIWLDKDNENSLRNLLNSKNE